MKNKALKLLKNPYFQISAVYFLAHFFLLILSGCWWDDWTFMSHNLNYINEVASQSGRPEWNILIPFCWSLPNNGRILIFFLYYLDSIFVYRILKESLLFNEKQSLLIALLFSVLPQNDARILISNFPYSVGLCIFFFSFMLFVVWNKMEDSNKKKALRVLLLISFLGSFILNSVLAYYYIIIAYLWVLELKNSKEKGFFRIVLFAVRDVLLKYPDFFILPFVYYFSNKILFPTYGDTFGNYNSVSLAGLLKCIIYIPLTMIKLFYDTFLVWGKCLVAPVILLIVAAAVICAVRLAGKQKEEGKTDYKELIIKLIYGLFVLFMGLFPYVTVRGRVLVTTGVRGRDAILAPLGMAIMMFALFGLLKRKFRTAVYTFVIVLGIFGFNSLYLEWQKDYYYQLSLENLLDDPVIAENDTFFLVVLNETEVDAQRYYSLNANAYNVYGDESRLFIPTVSNLYFMRDEKSMQNVIQVLDYSHVMRDYKPENYLFDAVLNFDCKLSNHEVLELKFLELFDKERFNNKIKENGTLDIYIVDDDFTYLMYEKYDNNELRGDADVLELVLDYVH